MEGRGRAFGALLERTVPVFAGGSVPTGMAYGVVAQEFAREYDALYPEIAAASKRHSTGYDWPPAFTFTRPFPNPRAVLIGEHTVDLSNWLIGQDFSAPPSTSLPQPRLYSGLPGGRRLSAAHEHVNALAAKVGPYGHLGAYTTPAGHWRIGDHELGATPSSSAIGDSVLLELIRDIFARRP